MCFKKSSWARVVAIVSGYCMYCASNKIHRKAIYEGGNKSYNVWIRDWTFLLVNYTGYQNSRLVHKQQPADSAAFVDTTSNLFKITTTGI